MDKIRVLHFSLSDVHGGIETFIKNICLASNKNIINEVISLYENSNTYTSFSNMGVSVHVVASRKNIFAYFNSLRKLMKKRIYNVVHIHKNSCADIIPFLAAKSAGIKNIILHSHCTRSSKGKITYILHFINRPIMLMNINKGFACSKDAAIWMFGKDYLNKGVEVLKNGVFISNYKYNEKNREKLPKQHKINKEFVVGHVGRFEACKNHSFILDVFKEILKILPNSVLVLLGDGSLAESIVEYAKKIGVYNNTRFLGAKDNANEYYSMFDAFLFPSIFEGLPFAVIEAQTAGLPCFISDNMSRQVEITKNVYRVSLKDAASKWANLICTVCSDDINRYCEQEIRNSGYDFNDTFQHLQNFYI